MAMKIARFSGSTHLLMLLLAVGVLERVAWNIARPAHGAGGEAMRVAVAVAGAALPMHIALDGP